MTLLRCGANSAVTGYVFQPLRMNPMLRKSVDKGEQDSWRHQRKPQSREAEFRRDALKHGSQYDNDHEVDQVRAI